MSSNLFGFICLKADLTPELSSWNNPVVSPVDNKLNISGSLITSVVLISKGVREAGAPETEFLSSPFEQLGIKTNTKIIRQILENEILTVEQFYGYLNKDI